MPPERRARVPSIVALPAGLGSRTAISSPAEVLWTGTNTIAASPFRVSSGAKNATIVRISPSSSRSMIRGGSDFVPAFGDTTRRSTLPSGEPDERTSGGRMLQESGPVLSSETVPSSREDRPVVWISSWQAQIDAAGFNKRHGVVSHWRTPQPPGSKAP
jgi:hypothetical protein